MAAQLRLREILLLAQHFEIRVIARELAQCVEKNQVALSRIGIPNKSEDGSHAIGDSSRSSAERIRARNRATRRWVFQRSASQMTVNQMMRNVTLRSSDSPLSTCRHASTLAPTIGAIWTRAFELIAATCPAAGAARPARLARRLQALTTDRAAGMELRVFGLQREVLGRFRGAWRASSP